MKDKKLNKRNNSYPNILLAILLLYPIFFSFSHSLTHHSEVRHIAHYVSHQPERTSTQSSNYAIIDNMAHVSDCPICDYKFAPCIKSGKQAIQSKALQLAIFNFPLSESIPVQELFSKSSPRAPPVWS